MKLFHDRNTTGDDVEQQNRSINRVDASDIQERKRMFGGRNDTFEKTTAKFVELEPVLHVP